MSDTIAQALLADGAGAKVEAALGPWQSELAALGNYVQEVLATGPAEQKVLVTAHDAVKYFGGAFAFEVQGIQGISTESEAGVARLEALVS